MGEMTPAEAIGLIDAARIAVFSYRRRDGTPIAIPVTPYVEGDRVVVTSALWAIDKGTLLRADGRSALLAGGVHVTGDARVQADVSGDVFVARFLEQERRKFPPVEGLLAVPDHRTTFSWYFGCAIYCFTPRASSARPGADRTTLTTIDADGYPDIVPMAHEGDGAPSPPRPDATGPAVALLHEESDDMSKLTQRTLRGTIVGNTFAIRPGEGWLEPSADNVDYAAREQRARRIMKEWEQAT